jgi:SAM-dependent methyltransferase
MSPDSINCTEKFRNEIMSGGIKQSEHEKCPLCFTSDALLIAEIDRLGIPCETVVCKGCGLVFNDSFFSADSLEAVYKEFYGKINFNGLSPEETFLKRTSPDAYSWKRFAYISLQLGSNFRNINTVFEIGCRDGCNLLPFYLADKEVMGCDFDEEYLNAGRKRGLNLIRGGTDSLIASGKKADLIILSHVVEHFLNLDKEIIKIKNLLNDNGYVYVEVPGLFNWNRKRCNAIAEDGYRSTNDFLSYLQSVHNYHFDLEKISLLFEKTGFKMKAGDEWVRAIFRNGSSTESAKRIPGSAEKVLTYLKSVDRDYRSLYSQFNRIARKIL